MSAAAAPAAEGEDAPVPPSSEKEPEMPGPREESEEEEEDDEDDDEEDEEEEKGGWAGIRIPHGWIFFFPTSKVSPSLAPFGKQLSCILTLRGVKSEWWISREC
jgi:hypothetical protein